MLTASSAMRVCTAYLSASLNTATVGMPRRLAVRITRHAISPRLATSSLLNSGAALSRGSGRLLSPLLTGRLAHRATLPQVPAACGNPPALEAASTALLLIGVSQP
jgi:hypothetical protein